MSRPRVIVVGGGLAGLQAALACSAAGAGVTLLEARARLGGATWSTTRDGLRVDNGQHLVDFHFLGELDDLFHTAVTGNQAFFHVHVVFEFLDGC